MTRVHGPCPVLVEREPELRALSAAAGECAVRGSRLVLITGEAGAGKTRLWTEFLDTLPDGWTTRVRRRAPVRPLLVGAVRGARRHARRRRGERPGPHAGRRAGGGLVARAAGVAARARHRGPALPRPGGRVAALPHALARLRGAPVLVIATYRIGSHPVGSEHSRAVAEAAPSRQRLRAAARLAVRGGRARR